MLNNAANATAIALAVTHLVLGSVETFQPSHESILAYSKDCSSCAIPS